MVEIDDKIKSSTRQFTFSLFEGTRTMAHQISTFTDENGNKIAEAMYANKPAWHGLGEVFDVNGNEAPNSATAMKLAHLDWDIELQPMYLGDGSEVGPDYFASIRSDNGATLGIVGSRYRACQNRDAFAFLDGLCQDGIIRYESAFAMSGGSKIALLARMPSVDDFGPKGDQGLRYVAFTTSHDGTGQIKAFPTSTRIVCANTLAVAIGVDASKGISIRHTGSLKGKLKAAHHTLAQFDEQFTLHAENCRKLYGASVNHDDAAAYIAELYPEPEVSKKSSHTRWANSIASIRSNVRSDRNRIDGMGGTWWQMVNAVTEHVDHSMTYKGSDRKKAESRFLATVAGRSAEFKTQAFDLALSMSGVLAS